MADVQAVARRPLWAEGGEVDAALRALAGTLRQLYGRPRQEDEGAAGSDAAGESGGQASALDAAAAEGSGAREELELEVELEDEKKLATSQEDAAAALAARRAAQLQPACLKLVKDLLQRRAGAGKHD